MKYISELIKINLLNVVGVFKKDSGDEFRLLTIKKNRGKVVVLNYAIYESKYDLYEKLTNKLPIIVVFEGKGILEKKIDLGAADDATWYKNIDFESVFHTSFHTSKFCFISFCRRELVDDLTYEFKKRDLSVIDIYIGSFIGALLYDEIGETEILSNRINLIFENDDLFGFSKYLGNSKQYFIGNESVNSEMIPLFGAFIHYFVQQIEVTKTVISNKERQEFQFRKLFNYASVIVLIFFFTSLLASYIGRQYYNRLNMELATHNVYIGKTQESIKSLAKQRREKLELLNQMGLLTTKFQSYYAYEIVKSIPNGINITKLNISPAAEIKNEKEAEICSNKIIIKGVINKQSSIDLWVIDIKKMEWVEKVEIVLMEKDRMGISHFELIMKIKNV